MSKDAAPFQPPEKGTEEYDIWLDGPRPDAGQGRGQWLRARQLRDGSGKGGSQGGGSADGRGAKGDGDAQSLQGSGIGQPATRIPTGDAATRAALIAIRDNPGAHDSDRISAMRTLMSMDAQEAGQVVQTSPLVALRAVLDTLAPHERLAWLQGERIAHLQASE